MNLAIIGKTGKLNIGLALLIILAAIMEPVASAHLQYDRQALAAGEFWRFISGHLVHLGWEHSALNLLGLLLITLIFQSILSCKSDALALAVCSIGTSAGLWYFSPELIWYVGFSGVLHGYLIYYLLKDWPNAPLISALAIAGVLAKVLWEQSSWGDSSLTEALIGGPVAVDAHLYGTVSGFLTGLILLSGKTKSVK